MSIFCLLMAEVEFFLINVDGNKILFRFKTTCCFGTSLLFVVVVAVETVGFAVETMLTGVLDEDRGASTNSSMLSASPTASPFAAFRRRASGNSFNSAAVAAASTATFAREPLELFSAEKPPETSSAIRYVSGKSRTRKTQRLEFKVHTWGERKVGRRAAMKLGALTRCAFQRHGVLCRCRV